MKRPRGTGNLYLKHGAYYGRWRRPDGSRVNRRVGKARARGDSDGLTRAQAERELRRLIEADEGRPAVPVFTRPPTVDEAAGALRARLDIEGVRPSYRRNLESMQRIHISPAFGEHPIASIERDDIERLGRSMLARGLAPKTVRNVMSFLSSVSRSRSRTAGCYGTL